MKLLNKVKILLDKIIEWDQRNYAKQYQKGWDFAERRFMYKELKEQQKIARKTNCITYEEILQRRRQH
jgi:hypothetical protein